MQPAKPLVAVGISAAVLMGSVGAAAAKANPSIDTNQPNIAQSNAAQKNSAQSHAAQKSEPLESTAALELLAQASDPAPSQSTSNQKPDAADAASNPASPAASASPASSTPQPARSTNRAAAHSTARRSASSRTPSQAATPASRSQQNSAQAQQSTPSGNSPADAAPSSSSPAGNSGSPATGNPASGSSTGTPTTGSSSSSSNSSSNREPAPSYLDPSSNPLQFPTRPEEVQVVGTQPITLQQAVELAVRNNPDLQQNRLQVEQARAQLQEAQAANLPTLELTANLTNTGQDVTTSSFLGVGGGTSFQTSTSFSGGLQASYSLFTAGARPAAIRAAEGTLKFRQLQVEIATEDLVLQTIRNYYDLQQADEQVRIFRDALTQAEQSLRDAQALERAGVGTRFDVLQSQVDVANARQDLTNQLSRQEIARRQLAQTLSLSQSMSVAAAQPVEVAGTWNLSLEDSIVLALKNRAELEQQLVQREISEQNRRRVLAAIRPQVNVTAAYTFSDNFDSTDGINNSYRLVLGASWLLFDGGQARAQARQQESNIAIAENQFASLRDQIRFQVEQFYSQLQANFENIQTTSLAVQQAQEALRLARLRFQAGVGTQTDVLRQQTALTQAEVNRLQAILDYNRALASIQRAVSNLPQGYLNASP